MGAKFLIFLYLSFSIFLISNATTPQDNYLINCGSSESNVVVDNRVFVGDSSKNSSAYMSEGESIALKIPNPSSNSSVLYSSARVFTSASSYVFGIKNMGTHLVRLHFYPFSYGNYNLKNGNFSVMANGVSLLSNFGAEFNVVKEYFLMVNKMEFRILFMPNNDSSFAFVSAIEVFAAPKDLFPDDGGIPLISPDGIREFKQNISSQILETVRRVNVGGPKITPFNDTLWRIWVPDEDFLVLKTATKIASTTAPLNYQQGGATREDAPDYVYMTARQMNIANGSWTLFNITWDFPVQSGRDSAHFIRLHFCDIVSISLNTLYFNIYINGFIAYKDVDLSVLAFRELASPYYIDFVVKTPKDSNVLRISIGPSDLSTVRKNAILNGLEILRMVNFVDLPERVLKKRSKPIMVMLVVGGFLAWSLACIAILTLFKCKKRRDTKTECAESAGWFSITSNGNTALASPGPYGYYDLKIPFGDIQSATNNFAKNLIIGSGGFGTVYKGILRASNIKIAVKRGVPGSRQGLPEFQAEITVLSKIRHCHLVSFVGYCEEQSEMILVYEYMEKGPLRHHLYGTSTSNLPPLSWKQRLEICIGAARGLHYLHTGSAQGIIHRDIKSTNILLDENYVAKVADFGLSKSGPCLNESHVSTGVKGSFGYLDPEYFRRQQLTDKSDVYSFGVVLFEVLCARPAVDPMLNGDEVNLGEWALEWQKKGRIEEVVDRKIVGEVKKRCLKVFCETAEKCLSERGADRPSMGDVLWNLEHAYQLQMNSADDNGDRLRARDEGMATASVSNDVTSNVDEGNLDISASGVFSQLINKKGR